MDKQIDVEKLRISLKNMSRAEARAIAQVAGLSGSTVEKFRLNHIHEMKFAKLRALHVALQRPKRSAPQPATAGE